MYDIIKLKNFYTHDEMGLKSYIAQIFIANLKEDLYTDFIEREIEARQEVIDIMESKAAMGDKASAKVYKEMTDFDKDHPFMPKEERDNVLGLYFT